MYTQRYLDVVQFLVNNTTPVRSPPCRYDERDVEGRGAMNKGWHILHPHHAAIVSELGGVDEIELLKHPAIRCIGLQRAPEQTL